MDRSSPRARIEPHSNYRTTASGARTSTNGGATMTSGAATATAEGATISPRSCQPGPPRPGKKHPVVVRTVITHVNNKIFFILNLGTGKVPRFRTVTPAQTAVTSKRTLPLRLDCLLASHYAPNPNSAMGCYPMTKDRSDLPALGKSTELICKAPRVGPLVSGGAPPRGCVARRE
jgi:hypothetical protein